MVSEWKRSTVKILTKKQNKTKKTEQEMACMYLGGRWIVQYEQRIRKGGGREVMEAKNNRNKG